MSGSNDVELSDVKSPLMEGKASENLPEVTFKGSRDKIFNKKDTVEFHGLTKEELEQYAKDPFWRKLRIILFVIFWVVWIGMLIAAILIVVMSPKCPKKPKLEFWGKKTGYWLDPFAFADSNDDKIGDFQGIMTKLDYIEKQLGAGYIILDPIFKGQYSGAKRAGSVVDFQKIDPLLGNEESFLAFLKEARKRGIEIVLAADFNALSVDSDFLKNDTKNKLIAWDSKFDKWVNRNGGSPKQNFYGQDYYSAVDASDMCELNLKNRDVVDYIKSSVNYWMEKGVRGLFLTNVAMYVEDVDAISNFENGLQSTENSWYAKKWIGSQIFTNETRMFLKEIRDVLDKVGQKTGKSRLLIVDAGNVGFGLDGPDEMLRYLNDNGTIVDLVVSREFLNNRGWSLTNGSPKQSTVTNYINQVSEDQRKRVVLSSASSIHARSEDILNMASPFLVQGSSILYYGSELGTKCDATNIKTLFFPFYPQNTNFSAIPNEYPTKCNHMIMPWDNNGKGFFNSMNVTYSYIKEAKDTVQSLIAVGKGETVFQLHQKLIKLREEPSFQWGSMSIWQSEKIANRSYEIFTREAVGFPKMIVVLAKDSSATGKAISFKSICDKITPILVYPSNGNLPEKTSVDSENVYIHTAGGSSVHVFKCA